MPGLTDGTLIARLCQAATLPINVMMTNDRRAFGDMPALGVSRISFGPAPYVEMTSTLEDAARPFF